MNPGTIYIEISHDSLRVVREDAGMELRLERADSGRLTTACAGQITPALQNFLKQKKGPGRARVYCAIGAGGVSMRRLSLPAAGKDELDRLLLLQIESEFPLPPDKLAWGYRPIGEQAVNGGPKRQEVLVAAIKKEALTEYVDLFAKCGLSPLFTPAALARSALSPQPSGTFALLDLGRSRSEFVTFEQGVPGQVRMLALGEDATRDDASLDVMARAIKSNWPGGNLYLTGEPGFRRDLTAQLERRLTPGTGCARLDVPAGSGQSAAIQGLKKSIEAPGGVAPLTLQVQATQTDKRFNWSDAAFRKLAMAAGILLVAALLLPYAEAIALKPLLTRKLAAINSDKDRLKTIDKELGFLEDLQQKQPPYLDALYLFAKSAPPGSRFDSISMSQRGEISLRGAMQNFQQLADFRAKLIDSGFFATVTVEEQTPTPDRQRVNVRISAQWSSASARAALAIGPTPEEIEKAKNAPRNPAGGAAMMPGMPGTVISVGQPGVITVPAGARRARAAAPNPGS
jgi:Tfp pilus assembly protein PilN